MARKFNVSRLMKAFTIGAEFTVINTIGQAINAQPNVPPLVKTIVGAETMFANYEVAKGAIDQLPPMMQRIAKPMLAVSEVLLAVQQLPNLMASINSFAGGGNPLGGIGGTAGPTNYAPLA